MQKICILGSPGSGKSTLAKQLGDKLSLSVVHMDTLFWQPNWVASSDEELAIAQEKVLLQYDRWVIDGNYSSVWEPRLEQADTLILLDMPRWLCMTRVIKRFWKYYGRSRPDMASGCNEWLDWSFLWFVWNYRRTRRQRNLALLEKYRGEKNIIILQNKAEVEAFVASL